MRIFKKLILVLILCFLAFAGVSQPPCNKGEAVFPVADPNMILGRILCTLGVEPGGTVQKEIIGCDPDGDAVVLGVENLPEGATLNNWILTWSPKQTGGMFYVYLTLNDVPPQFSVSLQDYATVVLYIIRPNQPPVLGCR